MKKELQESLFQKYPKIFVQRQLPMSQTCMCWGIECGDGWFKLLDTLCNHLTFNIERNGAPQLEAIQVKEKFGTLRFYIHGGNNEQYAAIHFAELLSGDICERCGSNQEVTQTQGWIKTLCKECLDKERNEIQKQSKETTSKN